MIVYFSAKIQSVLIVLMWRGRKIMLPFHIALINGHERSVFIYTLLMFYMQLKVAPSAFLFVLSVQVCCNLHALGFYPSLSWVKF